MAELTSTASVPPRAQEMPTRFEVRTVWLGTSFRPYGWEIINERTGERVRRSISCYRKPGDAWAAGVAALDGA